MAQIDSLSANEFQVYLNEDVVPGVFRVSGFIPFKLEVRPGVSKVVREPFKLAKMVQRDPALPFNRWLQETLAGKQDIVRPTRTLVIVALDDGVESRRWTVTGAWISEISYSDFNSASGELVEEVVTIHFDDIQETWAGGQLATS
ncbi:MAG: phage tail protein [Chloroflexi bacterium]|uniref:phage tail protein n=1 Tax=Candidatus Flexifilum breve TaxID=3140694 RepID=UPI003135E9CA|nr:phage tail protein [Chloroflexota bacterium]MBK9748487.1 phage tail protein [Chloroflexota bacterium]